MTRAEQTAKTRARMAAAEAFIRAHPGSGKAAIARAIGVRSPNIQYVLGRCLKAKTIRSAPIRSAHRGDLRPMLEFFPVVAPDA